MKSLSKSNFLVLLTAVMASLLAMPFISLRQTKALSGSDFHAGRIIDDSIFFNPNTMSATDIQNFLNSKVPTCDTNGTQTSEFGGGTRAQYGTSKGYPPPYTCLKSYSQTISSMAADSYCAAISGGTKSAAQIIKDVATACSINPEVILVLLQKEEGLVTDDWPWSIQYTAATGYGCPDTASCDPAYAGFFKQVYYGARQYQLYAKSPTRLNDYNYFSGQSPRIYYNPNTACGYSNVYLENQATAGLYDYTPYQPNNAALNDLYGSGDNVPGGAYCSSFGNRNFWRQFNDWFGPTTTDSSSWGTLWNGSNLYLVVGRTRYYVPSPSIENAWGLQNYTPINDDPNIDADSYFNSLTAGPTLGYVALDASGKRYMMDNGKKYFLSDDSHVLAWGMAGDAAKGIYAVGLLGLAPSGGTAGRFGVSASDGTVYLLNGVSKHQGLTGQSLSYWGYTGSNGTTVTDDILSRLSNGPAIDRYINAATGVDEVIDNSTVIRFRNSAAESGWGSHSYVNIGPAYATDFLTKVYAGTFVRASNDSRWYYLEGGNKHYVSSSNYLTIWGWGSSNPLTVISPSLLSSFGASDNLGYIVSAASTGKHYLIDGFKHWLPTTAAADAWEGGMTVPSFTDQSLSLLTTGGDASSELNGFSGDGRIYALDDGKLRGVPSYNILLAYGMTRNNPIKTFSSALDSVIPKASTVDYVVQDGSGDKYFLDNGYRYRIDNSFANTWLAVDSPVINANTLAMFTDSGKTIGEAISQNGHKYLMDGRKLIHIGNDYINYGLADSDFISVDQNYFPVYDSSHLIGTPGNNKIWLLSMGRRYYIPNSGLLFDLGYGSTSGITTLNPDIIATLPEDTSPASRLIKAPDTGVIFALRGRGYGFWDSATFSAYGGSSAVLVEPSSVFNKFSFSGWTSRIIYGTDGKLYYLDSGQKQWIANPSLLNTRYSGINWWSLPQYSVDSFPTGSTITN
jgi:hypothetical protein